MKIEINQEHTLSNISGSLEVLGLSILALASHIYKAEAHLHGSKTEAEWLEEIIAKKLKELESDED
jgi:hypothetical protein